MKKILVLLAALSCAVHSATIEQFDFDGNAGKAEVTGKVRYVDGVRGKALALSDGTARIACPAKITPSEGTMTMWVKPMNWSSEDKEFFCFLQNVNAEGDGRIILYKYQNPGLGLLFWYGNPKGEKTKDSCYANSNEAKLEKGKWSFLAITWSRKASLAALFVNGKKAASAKCTEAMFFDKFGDFILNAPPFRPANREFETAYDMVKLYDEALPENELEKRFQEEAAPSLDIPIAIVQKTIFTLPMMETAPRIDGNFEEREWTSAAKLGGMVELGKPRLQGDLPTEVFAGYHGGNLYLCFLAKLEGATKMVCRQTKRDSAVYMDDAFEIHLRPPELKQGNYHAIVNYNGTIYDTFLGKTDWNGSWTIKNGIYEGQWSCELSIPISELQSQFREGAEWAFNLCRDRQVDPNIIFSSVSPSAMPFSAHYGTFRMTEQCFGRLTVDYAQLFERSLEFVLELRNPSSRRANVIITVEKIQPDGTVTPLKEYRVAMKGNGRFPFKYQNKLEGFRSGIIRVTAIEDNGQILYRQDLPIVFKDEAAIDIDTSLKEAKLKFSVDLKSHYMLMKAKETEVILKHGQGLSLRCIAKGNPLAQGEFDLNQVTVGDCTLEFRFRDGDGKEIMTLTKDYKHIGIPPWLNVKKGVDLGVVYPYTPIVRKGDALSVLGREHRFGKTLLPAQIISQGIPLFASKPALKAKVNGRTMVFDNFKFERLKDADDETVMAFKASAGGVNISGKVTLEFDGFLWYSVNVEESDVVLDELSLEMEFPGKVAEFYNAHFFARENYVGRLHEIQELKRTPSVWLGNLDVGLTMVVESFEHWRNQDEKRVFVMRRDGDKAIWQVRFIDKPTSLKAKPLTFEFGVEANPVKPTPPEFRSLRVHFFKNFNISHPWQIDRKIKKYPGNGGFYTPEHTSMEDFRNEIKRFRDQGAELSLYLNPFLLSTDATEYKIFRKEWNNPYNVYPICPASNFTDYIAWQIDDLIRNGGLRCVYVDSLGAINCANPLHGCGYIDENGNQQLTWPVRAVRNYMKRLYSMLHANGRDQHQNHIWAHMSARTSAPINAFVDFQCSGEELETSLIANSNYMELYGMDEFQIYYMKSSGVVPMLLPNLGRTGPKEHRTVKRYNDQILALVLLHDTLLWNLYVDMNYVNRLYDKLDAFGLKDLSLKYHSYRLQKMVTSPDADIFISVYELPGRHALAVIVNKQKEDREIQLFIDRQALGLPANAPLKDFRNDKPLSDAQLKALPIQGYNFALVQIGE